MAVGWNYVLVCVAQIAWTISFSMEIIWLSLVFMLAILFFLVRIVRAQGDSDLRRYLLLKFPFSIHTGWIVAASFVNISVLLVSLQISAQIQFYMAMASLSLILFIAGVFRYDIPILLVLAWALVRIEIVGSCLLCTSLPCSRSVLYAIAGNLHRVEKPQRCHSQYICGVLLYHNGADMVLSCSICDFGNRSLPRFFGLSKQPWCCTSNIQRRRVQQYGLIRCPNELKLAILMVVCSFKISS